jgi:hypothetical protein
MSQPLDQERVERLTVVILAALKENYQKGPISRDRVFEALNALAASVSMVIAGCDDGGEAMSFFVRALSQNMLDAREGFKKL